MSDYGKDAAGKRITSVQVQVGSSSFNGWVRTDVIFRGYQDMRLPHRVQEYVESPSFSCLGSEWTIRISYQNSNCLKFQLWPSRKEDVIAGISVINIQHWSDRGEFVADRNHIVANLVAGALWIEVRMRMARCRFIPDSSACRTLHDLLIDKESADVVFEIKGDQAVLSNDANKHEVGNFHFHAHRVILLTAASQLAELSLTDESPSRVEIPDISPATFEVLLHYIYGFKTTNFGEDVAHIKEIVDAADKYAVTNLKLDAEAWYLSKTNFTLENVIEHLLYADSKNCALLKEKAVEFLVENALKVCEMKVLVDAPKDVVIEVFAAVARSKRKVVDLFWNMSICELRRSAHEKGLDVDGSREMLISALESEAKSD